MALLMELPKWFHSKRVVMFFAGEDFVKFRQRATIRESTTSLWCREIPGTLQIEQADAEDVLKNVPHRRSIPHEFTHRMLRHFHDIVTQTDELWRRHSIHTVDPTCTRVVHIVLLHRRSHIKVPAWSISAARFTIVYITFSVVHSSSLPRLLPPCKSPVP